MPKATMLEKVRMTRAIADRNALIFSDVKVGVVGFVCFVMGLMIGYLIWSPIGEVVRWSV